VSICTPTFNRRPFIPFIARCVELQDYPKERLEWIIVDDGTDPIRDLVVHIPYVNYVRIDERLLLGKKRNLMHTYCSGDIILYMDDDDYYPPTRVSHAVDILTRYPNFLIAGCSALHVYIPTKHELYVCGPYAQNHATAATFAFRKELLLQTQFNDTSAISEEKEFLKNYTIPLIQLNTLQTIIVCGHIHNSASKEFMTTISTETKTVKSDLNIMDYITDAILYYFYTMCVNTILETYDVGKPQNKPELFEHAQTIIERLSIRKITQLQNTVNTLERQLHQKDVLIHKLMDKLR